MEITLNETGFRIKKGSHSENINANVGVSIGSIRLTPAELRQVARELEKLTGAPDAEVRVENEVVSIICNFCKGTPDKPGNIQSEEGPIVCYALIHNL